MTYPVIIATVALVIAIGIVAFVFAQRFFTRSIALGGLK